MDPNGNTTNSGECAQRKAQECWEMWQKLMDELIRTEAELKELWADIFELRQGMADSGCTVPPIPKPEKPEKPEDSKVSTSAVDPNAIPSKDGGIFYSA